ERPIAGGVAAGEVRDHEFSAGGVVSLQVFVEARRDDDVVGQNEQAVHGEVGAVVEQGNLVVGFLTHLDRAFVGLAGLHQISSGVVGGEHADVGQRGAAGVEGLGDRALRVNRADEVVGGGVESAARRELVADGVAAAEGL